MIFRLTAIALVLILAPVAVGQTRPKGATPNDPIKKQVLDVYRRLNEASLRNDFEELDRLMSDDYVSVGTHGEVTGNKHSVLSLMKAGRIKATYHKDGVLRVRVDRNRAVITGEAMSRLELDGHLVNLRYKFSDVFERRNGQWQNVLTRVIRFIPN
jgi:hypothetical protein